METLLLIGIGGLFVCIVVTALALLIYSGLFYPIEVGTGQPPIGSVVVAYRFRTGPYKEAGQAFSEVVRLAPKQRTIGVYYDDPKQVPAENTRYIVGAILAENSETADEELKKKFVDEGFKITQFPIITHAVSTVFPFRCTLSIFIALIRVYPELGKYLTDKRLCAHPMLEVYDDRYIRFMAPLARQEEFYVPETRPPDEERASSESTLEESCSQSNTSSCMTGATIIAAHSETSTTELLPTFEDEENATDNSQDREDESISASVLQDSGFNTSTSGLHDSGLGSEEATVLSPVSQPMQMSQADHENDTGSEHSTGSSFEELKLENGENNET